MAHEGVSRRRFLQNVAAGSTGAALGTMPLPAAADAATPAAALAPVTVESYPLATPGAGAALDRVKITTRAEIPQPHQREIRALSQGIELKTCGSEDEFHREVADTQVIYGGLSVADLKAARQLRWIQYTAAGVETILSPDLVESPVVLTNMQRIYAPAISETAIGLILALAHGINRYALQTKEHVWNRVEGLYDVSGMTLGIVGLGGIGSETAYRAHYGFGMKILAVDPKPLPKPSFVAELHSLDWLPKMVPQVDILMSAAPHTRQSEGMFNESIFRAMKPSALFINMSRGKLVDTPALVRALKEGWIAGAGLDVAYKEPLPADEPLWSAGNVIITSHTSGWTPRSTGRQMALFTENIRRYLEGLPLLNVVDKKRGY
ncbi:MAG: D-2-hydroxyacid dehydrogenase [Acidobacteria bacterium]|nr:D-2-hydroxyacid dehydrogenase [Acidobacteriota bacterium]